MLLTEVVGAVEPVGAENANLEMDDFAGFVEGFEGVVKGGSIVPFEVVFEHTQLVLNDVEVATVGPVVPQVRFLEIAASVYEQNRVELLRPISWNGNSIIRH